MKLYFLMGATVAFLMFGCKNHPNYSSDEHNETNINHSEVIFCSNKAKELGFRTQVMQPINFQQVIKTCGQIITAQGNERIVTTTISGVVTLSNSLIEGVHVNQGTSLANISLRSTTEGEPYEKARIAYESAKSEYERAQPLADKKIISAKEFNPIRQTYEEAKLAFDAMKQNSSPKGQNIPSPLEGFIKTVWVKEGDYVTMGQPIATVTQTQHLYLKAEVAERYYNQLPHITSAHFRTPYSQTCYSLESLNGKLLSIGKSATEEANFIPITFSFENKGNIVPGSYMEVFLLSHPIPNQMVIPLSALVEEQGLFHVYLQVDEETYLKQEIEPGMNNGKEVQVIKGLQPNDRVLVHGAQQLKLASASNSIPGHTHNH